MHLKVLYNFFLAIILMAIFLKGYFPITHHEIVIIEPPEDLDGIKLDTKTFYKPQIDRLVLIIIDALRYDFITETNMPYLHKNMNCMLKVKVEAPTVTLPRIKALTTGYVPQFIEIVLNLGAKSKVDDSFIHRAEADGKKMIFYGDNTWLDMFPELFIRKDGTTSFYVNDFTEVDDNVTRHIDTEIRSTDWDMMFLHYLGLDHIGHTRGPFSNLIKPKLHEMDDIIAKIIHASDTWNPSTLIMVTGDHGMKDSGGHGGTTYAETHVPLIIRHNRGINCASKDRNTITSQIDIANTLSALFGIAMPGNSIGKVLPDLMDGDMAKLLYISYYNAILLQRNTKNCEEALIQANGLFKYSILNKMLDGSTAKEALALYQTCLKQMSDELAATSVKQDVTLLIFALLGSVNCLLVIINLHIDKNPTKKQTFLDNIVIITILLLHLVFDTEIAHMALVGVMAIVLVANASSLLLNFNLLRSKHRFNFLTKLIPLILHGSLLAASSYIEDEQHIFYYFTCTASVAIAFTKYQQTKCVTIATAMPLTVIEIIRMARSINPYWFLEDKHLLYLQMFYIFSSICTYMSFKLLVLPECKFLFQQPLIFGIIFIYKFYFEKETRLAQVIWAIILVQIIPYPNNLKHFQDRILNVWILVLTFLLRPYNTILVSAMIMCSMIFKKSVSDVNNLIVIHVWLGYTFFFLQGHSNSIASIDLAPGYTGLSSYIPFIVGILTLFHCYGFQTLSLLLLFHKFDGTGIQNEFGAFNIIIGHRLFILVVIYQIIFIHRGHLFIWSVFAPKLLIECAHTLVLFIQILLFYVYRLLLCVGNKK